MEFLGPIKKLFESEPSLKSYENSHLVRKFRSVATKICGPSQGEWAITPQGVNKPSIVQVVEGVQIEKIQINPNYGSFLYSFGPSSDKIMDNREKSNTKIPKMSDAFRMTKEEVEDYYKFLAQLARDKNYKAEKS